ncbi:MAG: ABC transporter substrate-binding protein [Pseudobdellovibrionaceae bacterium]
MNVSLAKEISVGYVPITFPRDPTEVNLVEEHTILGQILEPLIDSDHFGNIMPGIAHKWSFEDNDKKIRFWITTNKNFSNGEKLVPEDVLYSINRHLKSETSQSRSFLSDIESIKIEKDQVVFYLKNANPSILKALTRDQLGILQTGWELDKKSNRPFIGTGPYQAVKIENQWFLEKNNFYVNQRNIFYDKIKLIFYKNNDFKIPVDQLPDVMPDIPIRVMEKIKNLESIQNNSYTIQERLSFSQTTFWLYPGSKLIDDTNFRQNVWHALDLATDSYTKKKSLARSTGMIPVGVQGHLSERINILPAASTQKEVTTIKLAYLPGVFSDFLNDAQTLKIMNDHNIQLELIEFTPQTIKSLVQKKPDIVTGSWAGAFNDPLGFLGLLDDLLNMPFTKYIGALSSEFEEARLESDWSKRALLFKNLSKHIIEDGLMLGGWKTASYFVAKNGIKENDIQFRFTPRFINLYRSS